MAELFTQLFPDDTRSDANQNQGGFRFNAGRGPGGFPFGNNAASSQAGSSDRMKKKGRVSAVADPRTSSVIISAASELMPQIAEMIAQLDSSPAKRQRVFVYSLENADVQQVEQILQDMFQKTTTSRNTANQNSALANRIQQNNQAVGSSTVNNGFGNVGGNGNAGGGGQFR
jgi:general secretion pathway protein D